MASETNAARSIAKRPQAAGRRARRIGDNAGRLPARPMLGIVVSGAQIRGPQARFALRAVGCGPAAVGPAGAAPARRAVGGRGR
jgi:hypothetical protein